MNKYIFPLLWLEGQQIVIAKNIHNDNIYINIVYGDIKSTHNICNIPSSCFLCFGSQSS